jgi:acyl-CoA hydrolase
VRYVIGIYDPGFFSGRNIPEILRPDSTNQTATIKMNTMKLAEKITAIEAARKVKSGDHVFIHGASAIPQALVNALAEVSGDLQYVRLYHLHLNGSFPLIGEEFRGIFSDNSFFMGDNVRQAVREKRADYIPVSLAELPLLLRRRVVPLDVALVSVSAPDKHGFVSLEYFC